MQQILTVIGLASLAAPLVWELHNDRFGDDHLSRGVFKVMSKRLDVWTRVVIAVLVSLINHYIAGASIVASIILSGAIHFFIFDYAIAALLGRSNWFEYLGEKSIVDNVSFWRGISPEARFVIRLLVLALALVIYF